MGYLSFIVENILSNKHKDRFSMTWVYYEVIAEVPYYNRDPFIGTDVFELFSINTTCTILDTHSRQCYVVKYLSESSDSSTNNLLEVANGDIER